MQRRRLRREVSWATDSVRCWHLARLQSDSVHCQKRSKDHYFGPLLSLRFHSVLCYPFRSSFSQCRPPLCPPRPSLWHLLEIRITVRIRIEPPRQVSVGFWGAIVPGHCWVFRIRSRRGGRGLLGLDSGLSLVGLGKYIIKHVRQMHCQQQLQH